MADEVAKPVRPAEGQSWEQQALSGENPDDEIAVRTPQGEGGTVKRKDLARFLDAGFTLESPEQGYDRRLERAYGDQPVRTAIEAGASTLTGGLTDYLGGEGLRERRKRNELAADVGTGLAFLAPIGAPGLIGKAGEAIGALTAEELGGGLAARVVGGTVRGVAEGGLAGAVQGNSQIGLSDKPVDLEHAATIIGSNVLYGAAAGGALGGAGKLMEEGAVAAKNFATEKASQWAKTEGAAGKVDRGEYPEFAGLGKKETREAIAVEKENIRLDREKSMAEGKVAMEQKGQEMAQDLFHSAKEFKDGLRAEEAFIPTSDKELAKQLRNAKLQIMKSLDNEKGFVTRGDRHKMLLDGLEKQEQALNKALEKSDELMARGEVERNAMYDALPKSDYTKDVYLSPEQAGWYREWKGEPKLKKQQAISISGEELDTFRDAIGRGDFQPPSVQRVMNARNLLEQNQLLQGQFADMSKTLKSIQGSIDEAMAGLKKSPRLEALEAHLGDISEKTFGQKMAETAGGIAAGGLGFSIGGIYGAAAGGMLGREAAGAVYERLVRKIGGGTKLRKAALAGHVASFFDKSAKAISKTTPLASKILPSVSYASKDQVEGVLGKSNYKESKDPSVTAFRERAREIDSMTQKVGPGAPASNLGGQYTVRLRAREALNQKLQAFWAVNPDWGNGIEAVANRRLEFLAEKMPRNPGTPHLQVGPESWEPSKQELAKFARYMEAVEHPEKVAERFANGTMTPEDAEVLRSVYPGMYDQMRQDIMSHLPEAKALPYQKRLALSIYLDVPADAAVTPELISVYQGLYQQQGAMSGSGGGAAPRPQKSFKSSEQATPAQKYGQ